MRAETYFLAIILAAMFAAVTLAAGFSYWQAKLAPISVGGVIIILTSVLLIKDLTGAKPKRGEETQAKAKRDETSKNPMPYFLEGIWMIGFVFAIYLFGFVIAIFVFGGWYMKAHGAGWSKALLVATLTAIFCYGVFSLLLEIRFYPGIILNQVIG